MQLCTCSCGVVKEVNRHNLRNGSSRSCGCRQYDTTTKHGMWDSKTYRIWQGLKRRCYDPKCKNYADYGGRGITYDPAWGQFENFFEDMGAAPEGLSIERKDNDGPYCKSNCVWATKLTQARNRRNTVRLAYKGEVKTLTEWAESTGISEITLRKRINAGWSDERAIGEKVETKFQSLSKKQKG